MAFKQNQVGVEPMGAQTYPPPGYGGGAPPAPVQPNSAYPPAQYMAQPPPYGAPGYGMAQPQPVMMASQPGLLESAGHTMGHMAGSVMRDPNVQNFHNSMLQGMQQQGVQVAQPVQQPMVAAPGQQTVVVVQQQPTFQADPMSLSRTPIRTNCPHCQADVISEMRYETGMMAYVMALFLCFMGLICFAWLPFYMSSCKEPVHMCPQCKLEMGRYRPPNHGGGRRRRHRGSMGGGVSVRF